MLPYVIFGYSIGGYFMLCCHMLFLVILLVAIVGYSIGGYCWLFYWCLLLVILLVSIVGYSIGGYWCLFYWWCRNFSFGFMTKAKVCKVVSQEGSLGVKSHAP